MIPYHDMEGVEEAIALMVVEILSSRKITDDEAKDFTIQDVRSAFVQGARFIQEYIEKQIKAD